MAAIRGTLTSIAFVTNTIAWTLPLYVVYVIRFLVPIRAFQDLCSRVMVEFAQNWITSNTLGLAAIQNTDYRIQFPQGLHKDRSYLVIANHQSWVDIVVLQTAFNRKIPFLRFFLKDQLKYVPLLGGAWKALDFPFMKRHSKEFLAKHPEKRGEDLAATRRACEKFRGKSISILNFLEGTRFTPAKHRKQNSPFINLLPPKAGGIAFVLNAMGDQFDSILDVTIFYPHGPQELWGLFTGKVPAVDVIIEQIPIPKQLLGGDYFGDDTFRGQLQDWLKDLWHSKDQKIEALKQGRR